MKGWRKGFKVVYTRTGKSLSSVSPAASKQCYRKGEVTKPTPGEGPLGVFETLREAFDFRAGCRQLQIFTCWYRPSRRDYFARYIRGVLVYNDDINFIPSGTVFATAVMLIERVV